MIELRMTREKRIAKRKNDAWAKILRNKDRLVELGIPVDTLDPDERSDGWKNDRNTPPLNMKQLQKAKGLCQECGEPTDRTTHKLCFDCHAKFIGGLLE